MTNFKKSIYQQVLEFSDQYYKDLKVKDLQEFQKHLRSVYHLHQSTHTLSSRFSMAAYATARMPATYHAIDKCFQHLPSDFLPQTILDLGAGPGTASLAALDRWSSINHMTLIENHPLMINFQQSLWAAVTGNYSYELINKDLDKLDTLPVINFDLVILAYVLGELSPLQREKVILEGWKRANHYFVIVTPGTPYDFEYLLTVRDLLLKQEAQLVAPCPHQDRCPLSATSDWCHFSVRLERSLSHKLTKQGTLNYEDEKFSYMIFKKSCESSDKITARIIRRPLKRSGHIIFDLCTEIGLDRQVIGKKDSAYKQASKSEWGDSWTK